MASGVVIGGLLSALVRGLTRNVALTSRRSRDPRLRGRTYAISFDDVWRTSLVLIDGGLKHWELLDANDEEGTIRGLAHSRLERFTCTVTVRISLDLDGQTRVDALAASRSERADLGTSVRRIHRFFTALDHHLEKGRDTRIDALRLDTRVHAARS